jgi:hypothetical protein
MPARFVEVVDVGAEASSTLASLLAQGQALVGTLSFNLSNYLNASSVNIDSLREAFSAYNITVDSLPDDWRDWALNGSIGAALNQTGVEIPSLHGSARRLVFAGVALIIAREIYVQWSTRRVLNRYGVHINKGAVCHEHLS